MSFNLAKRYPDLLEIMHFNEYQRIQELRLIFDKDIQDNDNFTFLGKVIRPLKIDGQASMDTVFNHLIKEEVEEVNEDGTKRKRRIFERDRSVRLHWVKFHIDKIRNNVEVFSLIERDRKRRKDVERTYIYDLIQEYVIVLEPQVSGTDYYLLSAYYLNKNWAVKNMKKKLRRKLPKVL